MYVIGAKERHQMKRMTLTIDEDLINEAQKLLGVSTKRETVKKALIEIIRLKKRKKALTHCGAIELALDQHQLESLREEL